MLCADANVLEVNPAFAIAVEVLRSAEQILVFTGAGISTESGIPDFRGPDGLWTRMDPDEFSIDRYLGDAEVRKRSWEAHREGFFGDIRQARPNEAHEALTRLWRSGRLAGCVTQNIDGLHLTAGLPADAVAELHGNLRTVECVSCSDSSPIESTLRRVAAGDTDPACTSCGSVLKTSTVLFGEMLPQRTYERAVRMAAASDAVMAVGTTLSVFPAADVVLSTVMGGVDLVIVNQGRTAFDDLARVLINGPAAEVLPDLIDSIIRSGDSLSNAE